jgi:hypothetical protein
MGLSRMPNEPVIHAPLNHIVRSPKWDNEKAYEMWIEEIPPGLERSNVEFQVIPDCPITDIRNLPPAEQPTLDREGYQILHSPFSDFGGLNLSSIEHLDGDEAKRRAMRTYLASMTEKLRDQYDGVKAVCFDWRVRNPEKQGGDSDCQVLIRYLSCQGAQICEPSLRSNPDHPHASHPGQNPSLRRGTGANHHCSIQRTRR